MTKDPNFRLGLIFLVVGLGLTVALDPWFIGLAFLLIGANRLYTAYAASRADGASGSE